MILGAHWLMSNAKSNTVSTEASIVMLTVKVATAFRSLHVDGLPSSYLRR